MTIDNSSYKLPSSTFDIGKGARYSFDQIGNALAPISDALLGTNFVGNSTNMAIANMNLDWQKEYAKINEGLLRESWSREDNAVQRRVADLKAAGLSPTLAAGSAAASSSPIQLKAPQNEFRYENPFGGGVLQALSSVMALKNADLQNQLLKKQVDTYGEPAWFKALNAVLDKLGKGQGPVSNAVENIAKSMGFSGKVEFTPKFGFTYANPSPDGGTKAASVQLGKSAQAHGAKFDESSMVVTFDSAKSAREWYLSIGGTSFEWYYGIKKYKTPAAFLSHIIGDGYITNDGDVYIDR